MSITSTLHLNFRGRAKEALEFYHSVFGGDLVLAPYGDVEAGQSSAQSEQIAWGQVTAPNGFHVMAYDVQDSLPYAAGENAFYVSLRGNESAEIERLGTALAESEGAVVHVPFGPSVFSPLYGKLTDRFGVTWIIDVVVPWAG
ncbi:MULTISPECIES: VOC family protein [unclassified Rathayibacter]|uniref:VOC family protein n=1 Tax=unclassified Rathayibacter TaxID=2609250 RepID=UPI001FB41825|nr:MULTISPECIES: VOC family protein [unclassified Rathayibacter]MCJ1671665.1 VOC family protein [Rathayibacter sp. VKM Ac-2929]MCJ1684163.1 VOC family protein [Rathayibacter sp. VKM Ac-2928]MCJ1686951.1 VOC family protein [Rathayibacter sp. VKM Ac-2927]